MIIDERTVLGCLVIRPGQLQKSTKWIDFVLDSGLGFWKAVTTIFRPTLHSNTVLLSTGLWDVRPFNIRNHSSELTDSQWHHPPNHYETAIGDFLEAVEMNRLSAISKNKSSSYSGRTIRVRCNVSGFVVDDRFDQGGQMRINRKQRLIVCKLGNISMNANMTNVFRAQTWLAVSRSHCALYSCW